MPINVKFDENNQYVIYEISSPYEMNDLYEAYKKEKEFRDATQNTVHMVVEIAGATNLLSNWLSSKATPGLTHPRSGQMLLVGFSSGLRMAVEVVLQVTRYKGVRFFKTRAEADAHLQTLISNGSTTA